MTDTQMFWFLAGVIRGLESKEPGFIPKELIRIIEEHMEKSWNEDTPKSEDAT